MNPRRASVALSITLMLTACTGDQPGADSNTTPSTRVVVETTTPSTTTTTTTLPEPTAHVTLEGASEELGEAVAALYTWVLDPGAAPPDHLAGSLVAGLQDVEAGTLLVEVEGAAHLGTISEVPIAVVTAGDDVVLAIDDGGWRIVGARLSRFDAPAVYGKSPRLVFIIGSDARPGEIALRLRADSLHIVSTVPEAGDGAIVGIPRDSWVEASYGGNAKFTNVMASRGPEVVVETAEILTGLDFEGYVVTGFKGFVGLIDAFGGFTIDIPFAMSEPKSKAYFNAGEQHVDGADALAFARNRTIAGGDLTRQFHHGVIMKAALFETQRRGIEALPHLLELLMEHTWTDLSPEDLLTLAASAYELSPLTLTNLVVPGTVGTAGAASVVRLDEEAFTIFEDLQDGLVENS
ncbi:MAG: LCP family protein [Acidimicrobiia bacterium]|nr:LCP family protein [Acidimicrobiia bacterium]